MSIPVPHTAMVLCAGIGSRMRPLTETTPKPLIKVGGKALMDWSLEPLIEAGVKRVVVNLHWLPEQIEAHLKARTDVEVIFSDERGERLETGGGLAKARPLLGDDPIFVVNTDAFWSSGSSAPFQKLAEDYQGGVQLLTARKDNTLGFPGPGDFYPEDTGEVSFRGERDSAPLAFAGVRITDPNFYNNEPVRAFSALEVWRRQTLRFTMLDEFWLHVGTPQSVKDADFWLMCHGRAPVTWPKGAV